MRTGSVSPLTVAGAAPDWPALLSRGGRHRLPTLRDWPTLTHAGAKRYCRAQCVHPERVARCSVALRYLYEVVGRPCVQQERNLSDALPRSHSHQPGFAGSETLRVRAAFPISSGNRASRSASKATAPWSWTWTQQAASPTRSASTPPSGQIRSTPASSRWSATPGTQSEAWGGARQSVSAGRAARRDREDDIRRPASSKTVCDNLRSAGNTSPINARNAAKCQFPHTHHFISSGKEVLCAASSLVITC